MLPIHILSATESPNVIIVVGPPGCGKGHFSQYLNNNYGYQHISAGDLLRQEKDKKTVLGQKIEETYDKGEPVSDEIMHDLLQNKISEISHKNTPFIIDGFGGQSEFDAKFLYELLKLKNLQSKATVIFFSSSDENCTKRMNGRLICRKCSCIYNVHTSKPKVENKCDICNEILTQREQDSPQKIEKRLYRYRNFMEKNYQKLAEYFNHIVYNVDFEDCSKFYRKFSVPNNIIESKDTK